FSAALSRRRSSVFRSPRSFMEFQLARNSPSRSAASLSASWSRKSPALPKLRVSKARSVWRKSKSRTPSSPRAFALSPTDITRACDPERISTMARKKAAGHGGGHGWFVTFADLMGLLVAFFVMLVAFSTQDQAKLQVVAGSMREAFGVQDRIRYSGVIEVL